jgi:hypothetical protein
MVSYLVIAALISGGFAWDTWARAFIPCLRHYFLDA